MADGNGPAKYGVCMWDENGKCIWRNKKQDIWHAYAMNLDPYKRLWFYYYGVNEEDYDTLFFLVASRKEGNLVFAPDIRNSRGFAVSRDYKRLYMGGGYKDESSVYVYDMDCDTQSLSNKRKMTFEFEGKEVRNYHYTFSEDKVFLFTPQGTLLTVYLK